MSEEEKLIRKVISRMWEYQGLPFVENTTISEEIFADNFISWWRHKERNEKQLLKEQPEND